MPEINTYVYSSSFLFFITACGSHLRSLTPGEVPDRCRRRIVERQRRRKHALRLVRGRHDSQLHRKRNGTTGCDARPHRRNKARRHLNYCGRKRNPPSLQSGHLMALYKHFTLAIVSNTWPVKHFKIHLNFMLFGDALSKKFAFRVIWMSKSDHVLDACFT